MEVPGTAAWPAITRMRRRQAKACPTFGYPCFSAAIRFASMRPCGPPGSIAIFALLARIRCVSNTSNSAVATSGSRAISWKASPSVAGRMAAALANSMAAYRSAELVITLTLSLIHI